MAKFWTSQELSEILTKSSPHVRYLLWELFVKKEVPRDKLESKPVALAIVQRLCRSKGKDSLVVSGSNGDGASYYKLNPEYLEDFQNLLSKDMAPEKPKEKPKEAKIKKGPLVSTRLGAMPAASAVVKRTRGAGKGGHGSDGEEVILPVTEKTDFQFWFDLIRKINARANVELTILSNGESIQLRIP